MVTSTQDVDVDIWQLPISWGHQIYGLLCDKNSPLTNLITENANTHASFSQARERQETKLSGSIFGRICEFCYTKLQQHLNQSACCILMPKMVLTIDIVVLIRGETVAGGLLLDNRCLDQGCL